MKRNGSQSTLDSFFGISKRVATQPGPSSSEGTDNMASNQSIHSGASSRGREYQYRGIRGVREVDPENHARMAEELSKMANNFVRRLNGKSWEPTSRFFSDVFVYRNEGERLGMERLLSDAGSNYRRSLFWFVTDFESNHIHLIHDCSFSNRSCRCAWRAEVISKFPGSLKQALGKRRYISKFCLDDWIDVFIYYCLRKWGKPQKIWFDGEDQGLPSASESLRWEEVQRESAEILARNNGRFSNNLFEEGQGNQEGGSNVARSGWINVRPKATEFDYIYEKIQTLLEKYPSVPLSAIEYHEEFTSTRSLINPKNARMVEVAIREFGKRLNNFSLRDFYMFYSKEGCEPVFDPSKLYYDVEDSLKVVDDLLKFQFDDDENQIRNFLDDIVTVFDKKLPKQNTLAVISPPSGGKNFFFDMLFSISVNTGQLTIANKHNNFAFQEAPGKRLLVWNEPNYCSSYEDMLKLILGGDSYVVRVKCKPDTPVQRTPVFVLTNNVVSFMYDPAFAERVKSYTWKKPDWLKDYYKKPHPMSFFSLLIKYNIEFYMMCLSKNSIRRIKTSERTSICAIWLLSCGSRVSHCSVNCVSSSNIGSCSIWECCW